MRFSRYGVSIYHFVVLRAVAMKNMADCFNFECAYKNSAEKLTLVNSVTKILRDARNETQIFVIHK